MGQVGSKTSEGQILAKPCVRSRGHISSPIIMKLDQNVCLDEISIKIKNELCWVKNLVIRSNVRKTLCMFQRPHFSRIIMKLCQNICLDKISDKFENGSCRVKKVRS